MSFFYSDLPDDTVFFGTGILRNAQDESFSHPVQVSWLVHKHLFTFRMPWVHFSEDGDSNLELQDLRLQTPHGALTANRIEGFLNNLTPVAITAKGEHPLLWGVPPSIYSLPMDTPCEWKFRPCSSLLELSHEPLNEKYPPTHIKLAGIKAELLECLPEQLTIEKEQIFLHGTGVGTKSKSLHLEIPSRLGERFLDCIYLSLEVLQGHAPKLIELRANSRLEISKYSTADEPLRFDLWMHSCSPALLNELLPQLLLKLHLLPEEVFEPFRTTVKLISFGKTAQAPLEVKFLMLISALIILNNTDNDSFGDAVTCEILGIHKKSARLLRGLRNKLLHGGGSFHRAYPLAISDQRTALSESDLEVVSNDLGIPITPNSCNFPHLWLRLCERLSAYLWVSLLVSPPTVKHQSYRLPPMALPSGLSGLLAISP